MRRPSSGLKGILVAASIALAGACAQATPVSGQGTWETTLQARDINKDGVVDAYYDTALDITWLADWNINGKMDESTAAAWVTGLDEYGVTGWRLPHVYDADDAGTPVDCGFSGTNCGYNVLTKLGDTVYSEMAYLWYVELGNKALYDTSGQRQAGSGLTNTANFLNIDRSPDLSWAWLTSDAGYIDFFDLAIGLQNSTPHRQPELAVGVHDGDVCSPFPGGGQTQGCFPGPGPFPAPEPTTLALFGVGLAGLAVNRRRSVPSF